MFAHQTTKNPLGLFLGSTLDSIIEIYGFNDGIVGSKLIKKSINLSLIFDERNYLIARDCNPSSSKKRRNGTSSSASYFSLKALIASSE